MDDALYRLHAEREETYWWFVAKNRIIVSLVDRYLPPESFAPGTRPRAFDIGCGCGGLLKLLAPRFEVIGLDMSPIARDYCAKRGFTALDGSLPDHLPLSAEHGDAFDLIVMSEVLEHVEQDRAAVEAVVKLLKPGGLLVCTVPAHQWMWSSHDVYNHHFRRYSRAGFARLFHGLPLSRLALSYANAAMFAPMAAVRVAMRIFKGDRPANAAHAGPEIRPLPALINRPLTAIFAAERLIIPHVSLPVGSSVVAAFRRNGPDQSTDRSKPTQTM